MRIVSRRIFLVVMAVCVMSAVAVASASAYTNPILENSKGEHVSKVKFTTKFEGGAGVSDFPVLTDPAAQECEKESGTGELSTTGTGTAAKTSGTLTAVFTGCMEGNDGWCHSGKTQGEIESKLSFSLVWVGKESEEKPGVLSSITPMSEKPGNGKGGQLDFTCVGIPIKAEGAFVASFSYPKLGEALTTSGLVAQADELTQEYKKYTQEGKEGENNLFASSGGGLFAEAAASLNEKQTYGETVKIAKS
jgi:hypothetical protein